MKYFRELGFVFLRDAVLAGGMKNEDQGNGLEEEGVLDPVLGN